MQAPASRIGARQSASGGSGPWKASGRARCRRSRRKPSSFELERPIRMIERFLADDRNDWVHVQLLDHLVGADEDRGQDREAERLSGLEIDGQLKFGRLFDRQISWLCTV
jgi:hypothetical protein